MSSTNTTPTHPELEAVIRSPLGEVRVWLVPDDGGRPGGLRTALRIDYADEAEAVHIGADMARVVARLAHVVRGLAGTEVAPAAAVAGATTFAPWLAARTEIDPTARTLIRHLHQDYIVWCDDQGLPAVTLRDLGHMLSDRGFTPAGLISQGGFKGQSRGGLRIRMASVAGAVQ